MATGTTTETTRRFYSPREAAELLGVIGCECLSLRRCSLLNAGDRAAARGAGPRYLLGDDPDD